MSGALWRARLFYWTRRVGVPGWIGVLSLLAALLLLQFELRPAQQRLAILAAGTVAAQQRLAQPATSAGALTPTQQLNAFYAAFPQRAKVPDVLASMYEIAKTQKLDLDVGEYTLTKEQGARLDTLRIALPVKGSYVQLRQFTAEVLLAQPALALERVSIRREKVFEAAVTGRLVFLLFVEHAP